MPQLLPLVPVAYAGGPMTMEEPLVVTTELPVADPDVAEAVIVDVGPEEAQASFSTTVN